MPLSSPLLCKFNNFPLFVPLFLINHISRLAALACVDGIAFADAAPAEGAEGKSSSMSFAFNSMIACLLFFIFLVGAAVDIPVRQKNFVVI